jgi:hypothetical protein
VFSGIKIMHAKERTTQLTDIYNEEKAGNTIISWKQKYQSLVRSHGSSLEYKSTNKKYT